MCWWSLSNPRELASGKLVLDEPCSGVSRLRICNPERRGALDHEILDALAETVAGIDSRCLVLTGTGEVFSSGYDIGNLEDEEFAKRAEELVAHPFHGAIEALDAFPYPVIAQLNGHTIGGGLELAVSCDIRMAAREARLGMPPAKLGLIYSHTGVRKFLDLCGPANTAELLSVGENVRAERALEMGLLNHVVDPSELEQRTNHMAGAIVSNAPLSLRGNKRIIRTLQAHAAALPPEVEQELIELRESCFRTEDFREGVRAFAEKRDPEWKGR
jgi:enoyl-CoA hydratase/carnithine racemase